MARHNELGAWGEKVAREYLLTQGYAIGGENTRIGNYEIDFIAMKGDRIVFVEVKTRSTDYVDPLEAVDSRKRARLVRAADEYIRSMNIRLEPQFDIITVVGSPEKYEIEHFPDAFFPPLRSY
ncbi:MAG: YraN family protein [Duncaniella sp.]|nr:YraN family protein [Duncaniella sp.]HBI59129.1 endonuclease [Porphyromonadaceae bacterium]